MYLDQETIAALGDLSAIAERVAAHVAALEAHRSTVDVPAPTEDPVIEQIACAGGMDAVVVEPADPRVPDVPSNLVALTPRQFRERFTQAEQDAIDAAAMTDLEMFRWRLRAAEAQLIELNHPETVEGIALLVAKRLISDERAGEMLADRLPA
ncbi:MAG TPA: hypothetical protein VGN75_18160 [Kaistia sp.]|jgi:hypothetical protein|nr:hypothetical protein [Kaistia sp.]